MIKQVEFPELAKCLSVIRESFATVAQQFGLTEQNAATNGAFMKIDRLEKDFLNGSLMYGLFAEGQLAGFIQLTPKDGAVYEMEKLAVLPSCRHHGYGKQLIEFAKDEVSKLGGKKITIGIIEENTILKYWYMKNGFMHLGIKKFAHLPFTVGFMEMVL